MDVRVDVVEQRPHALQDFVSAVFTEHHFLAFRRPPG
jgi:hypothetical protein